MEILQNILEFLFSSNGYNISVAPALLATVLSNSKADPASAIQTGIGAIQSIAGIIKQKKADAAIPSREDAEQRMLLDDIRRRKRAFRTGTAFAAQRNNLLKMQQQGLQQSAKLGGGMRGVGLLANALSNASIGLEDKAINAELQTQQQESNLLNTMAQRRADTQKIVYDREQARAAKLKTAGNKNLMGGLSKLLPVSGEVNNNIENNSKQGGYTGLFGNSSVGSGIGSGYKGEILKGITSLFTK